MLIEWEKVGADRWDGRWSGGGYAITGIKGFAQKRTTYTVSRIDPPTAPRIPGGAPGLPTNTILDYALPSLRAAKLAAEKDLPDLARLAGSVPPDLDDAGEE